MHVVSDEYALVVISNGDEQNQFTNDEIKVIYFSEFRGDQVPFNYGITVLKDVSIIGSELLASSNADAKPP